MTTTGQNFTMWSGDTKVLAITITDGDGDTVNLTSVTIGYVLQKSALGGQPLISKSVSGGISITNAADGEFEITLDASDTESLALGKYFHECQITDLSNQVSTVFTGTVTIRGDII